MTKEEFQKMKQELEAQVYYFTLLESVYIENFINNSFNSINN